LLVLLLFPGRDAAADSVQLDPAGWPIQRELLPHSQKIGQSSPVRKF
jgi:hypothetical protein